ncbi:MAG: cell envelope integrity protein TolA [Gammaproteobacteria bacterium]|nr:cell envelope integrity protein TolA [Gammaproteobacteria bacterium]
MSSFTRDYSFGLVLSVLGHVVLLAVLGMRLISLPAPEIPRVPLAIEATVIDAGALRRREEEVQQRQAAIERQRQAAEEEQRRQQRAERQRVEAERQQAEQARVAAERKAEAARKAEAERQAEAERKAVAERKAAEEARVAEQKRKAEAERQRVEAARVAEQKRQEAQRQAEFQAQLEAEEQLRAAIASGEGARYLALIRNTVERNWVRPLSAKPGIECVVHVSQIPGGTVVDVRVGQCNGDASVVRSIIAAVEKSSPLPRPADPRLFDRNLRFTFKPEE